LALVTIEVLTTPEQVDAIAAVWDELAMGESRDGFFRTRGWYRAWMRHVRPEAQPFVLVAREDGAPIAGIAPLCRVPYRDLGFRMTSVAFGGREVVSGDFLDFLSRPEARSRVLAAMAQFLLNDASTSGLVVLGELLEDGDSLGAIESMARQQGIPLRRQEDRLCPYIALPATFDEYLGSLGSSTRYHVRRRIREVAKAGGEILVLSVPEGVAEGLGILKRLHEARWKKDGQAGTLGRPGFLDFLRDVCLHPPVGSAARLFVLRHQGADCGALLTFRFQDSVLYYQAGWDPDSPLAGLSPGVVVMAQSIRDAIESGGRYYEFLRGDEAYKSRWTKQFRRTNTLLVGRGALAREYLRVAHLKDAVKGCLGIRNPAAIAPAACSLDS
jgi:CelD/BcsL family acetyltransferase involved in cellulose biosynthesis